jgi:hypothetical protein
MMTRHVGPVGTIITDISQTILHIDDRYSEIVYRERASLIGQQALSFTYADDLPANKPVLDKLSGNGAGFTIVKRYVRSDGNLVWVRNHVTKITDGLGLPVLCATTQLIERPFGSNLLKRNYEAARRLCGALIAGRQQLTSDVVWAPATEALLWLYRAEIEGKSLNVDELAALTASAPSVMVRWVKLLQERNLVIGETPGQVSGQTCVRISAIGEQKLDSLFAALTD